MKFKLLFLILFLPALLLAEEQNVSVEFRAIAPGLAPMAISVEGANKEHFFEIPEGILSAPQKYQGGRQALFRDISGHRIFPLLFPESHKLLLVVLHTGPEGKPLSIVLENETPARALRFVNVTKEPLRIEAMGECAELVHGGHKDFSPEERKTVFIKISRTKNGQVILSNNWALDPKSRTLAILAPDSTLATGLRVHRFNDTP